MATNYPTNLDDGTSLPARSTGNVIPPSDSNDKNNAIIQLESKVGIGASVPTVAGDVLRVTGDGVTEYAPLPLNDLADVSTTGAATGEVLTYNGTSSTWQPSAPTGLQSVVAGTGVSVDSTDPANPVISAAGGGGGGGGQTVVTKVVAATGGDYTTLGAAIAAASNGWTILVKDSTTETGAITSTLNNLTIVGANTTGSVVALGSNVLTISGDGTTITRLGISISTGGMSIGGTGATITGCNINLTGGGYIASMTGANARFTNNYVIVSSSQSQSASRIYCAGSGAVVSDNLMSIDANSSVYSAIEVGGQFAKVSNNTCSIIDNATNGRVITSSGNQSSIVGNIVGCTGGRSIIAITTSGPFTSIGSNVIYRVGTGIKVSGGLTTVTGNAVSTLTTPDVGIDITANGCSITGNTCSTGYGAAPGIRINGGMDDCVIIGNRVSNYPTGISVSAASNDRTVIMGNALNTNTTPISDSGTGTVKTTAAADAYNSV